MNTSDFKNNHKPSTPEEWASFWVEIAGKQCIKQGMPGHKFGIISKKLYSFFLDNQCHPRAIVPVKIENFLSTIHQNDRDLFHDIFPAIEKFYKYLSSKYPEETEPLLNVINNFTPTTTDDLIARLLTEMQLEGKSPQTISTYCRETKKFLEHLNHNPTPGDRSAIESYLLKLRNINGLSPRTINLASAAIAFFYKHVIDSTATVKDIPRMKSGKQLPKVYGQGDIGKMINCIQNIKHRLVFILTYGCGLRLDEVRVLKQTDFDWDRKVIRINGKGSKQRDLPLDECFIPFIETYLTSYPDQVNLFEGRTKGKPYPKRTIQKIYDNVCMKAGINRKGGIHSLRHSYATHLHEQGVDINKIKTLLGHSNVKTTQIYLHVSKEELAKIRSPLASIKTIHRKGTT